MMRGFGKFVGFVSFCFMAAGGYVFYSTNFETGAVILSTKLFFMAAVGFFVALLFMLKGSKLFPLVVSLRLKPLFFVKKNYKTIHFKGVIDGYNVRLKHIMVNPSHKDSRHDFRFKIKIKNPRKFYLAVSKETAASFLTLKMASFFVSVPDLDGVKLYSNSKEALGFAVSLPLGKIFSNDINVENMEIRRGNFITRFTITDDGAATGKDIIASALAAAKAFEASPINDEPKEEVPPLLP